MQSAQLVITIVLIIIGIVLFTILLVELVNVPKPLIVPFADGTKIRIKSLANNLYLKPVKCSDITTCVNPVVEDYCSFTGGSTTIVSAIGQPADPETVWQLCQYSALSDSGSAKYVVFLESNQNTFVLAIENQLLCIQRTVSICSQIKTNPILCNNFSQFYFSFLLNEKSAPGPNTTSGSYNIIGFCDGNSVATSGIGAISLPSNICPPVVVNSTVAGEQFDCPGGLNDPRCELSYLFAIEVVSS